MAEREWREASDMRPSRVGLAIVLVTAAILRFWALDHGIPFAVGVDEAAMVERAVGAMRHGDFNPGFQENPGLYIHAQTGVAVARFLTGAIAGSWASLEQAPTSAFFRWGRALTALLGVATVVLVFQIGMRWGSRHALLAAGLLAVLPAHVRESHYVLTAVPLTFFVALAILLSLRAHERGSAGAFALAGAAAGLAAATTYTGILAVSLPLMACWMSGHAKPSRTTCALAVVGAAGAACLAGSPYIVLDLPGFLNGFARVASEYRNAPAPDQPTWLVTLADLRSTFGWPAVLLAGGGIVMGIVRLVRGPGRVRWALVTIVPLLSYGIVSRQPFVQAEHMLPLLPALCVLAAAAVISGVSLLRRYEIPRAPRRLLIVGLTVAALLPPGVSAIAFNRSISRTSTAALAYAWIAAHVPQGSTVIIESRGLTLPAPFRSKNVLQLRRYPYEQYLEEGVDYLVASSEAYGRYVRKSDRFPKEYEEYMRLFAETHEVARFSPSDRHPGPELRILKVKP